MEILLVLSVRAVWFYEGKVCIGRFVELRGL